MSEQTQTPEETQPVEEKATDTAQTTTQETASAESKDWFQQMLEDAGEDKRYFEKYKDKDSAKKGIVSAFQLVGKKGDIPKEDATPEERAAFWNKLGAEKLEVKIPEFGDEFGELKGQLGEYYGNIGKEISEIAKTVIPQSKGIDDAINKIVAEFAKRDGERTLKSQTESKSLTEQNILNTAKKAGLSVEQLKQYNQEVIDRFGWSDETSFAEILLELHKSTFNSPAVREAYLQNTNEGIEHQIAELKADPDWGMDTPKGRQLVQKRIELLNKMGAMQKK